MNLKVLKLAGVAASLLALHTYAHHSFAMFDNTKVHRVTGVVKEFEYINPHSWVHVTVTDAAGKTVTWSFEMGSTGQLVRDGWNATTVKTGDRITVAYHPLRDGSNGGQFRSAVWPDGKEMCQAGAGNQRCQNGQLFDNEGRARPAGG
jgi:hypothetical protein